jgi:thiol-disulfide isomerase/thioredoxin
MQKIFLLLAIMSSIVFSQEKNKTIIDEKSGKPILIGICDRKAFADSNFSWWYESEYQGYEINYAVLDSVKGKIADTKIIIVMGSWCSDSRREVPRFFRLMDEIKFSDDKLFLVCVDRKKESPEGNVPELKIEFVPTFIIYMDNKEIGRIIETPKLSLEKDLKEILFK